MDTVLIPGAHVLVHRHAHAHTYMRTPGPQGVLSISWSPHDPSLLLSSAKDNRTVCWDVHTADVLCELPTSSNWNYDVHWCPTVPGVFSAASFDGHVSVYNLHACTLSKVTETVNADFTVTHQVSGACACMCVLALGQVLGM